MAEEDGKKEDVPDLDPDTVPEPNRGYHHFPWAMLLFSVAILILVVLIFVVGHRTLANKFITASLVAFYWAIGLLIMHRCQRTHNVAGLWISFIVLLGLAVITVVFF